ncbi:MAG: hypothetical protein KF753_15360 [Caldilineaceae bacterium]|nr:hypothetical protein [Caldilineaceae bacterium]
MQAVLRFRPSVFAFSAILALILSIHPGSQVAQARFALCRSDPLVLLSDGTIIDISADIGALLFHVKEVHYTLHIPEGLEVVLTISTPNWPTTVEHFTVYADNPPGVFTSTTKVITHRADTFVTANFLVNTIYRTLDGVSGQDLTIETRL